MPNINQIADTVASVVDNLTTTKAEMKELQLQQQSLDQQLLQNQTDTNQIEAGHKSIFVAGWRPAIGWVGALGFFYQFILFPLLQWGWSFAQAKGWIDATVAGPPALEIGPLMTLLMGMLGIGAMRTYDKLKGTATDAINGMSRREARLRRKLNKEIAG